MTSDSEDNGAGVGVEGWFQPWPPWRSCSMSTAIMEANRVPCIIHSGPKSMTLILVRSSLY